MITMKQIFVWQSLLAVYNALLSWSPCKSIFFSLPYGVTVNEMGEVTSTTDWNGC